MQRPLIIFMLMASVAGAQTITGYTGNINHGASITIGGSSFGTKPVGPGPVKWDDFESNTLGTDIAGWAFDTGGTPSENPQSTNTRVRSGSKAVSMYYDEQYLNTFGIYEPTGMTEVYYDFWVNVDRSNNSLPSRNHKLVRFYQTANSGYPNHYIQLTCYERDSGNIYFTSDFPSGSPDAVMDGTPNYNDKRPLTGLSVDTIVDNWVHFQVWAKQGTVDALDGEVVCWVNGVKVTDRTPASGWGVYNRTALSPGDWHSIWFGNYYSKGTDDICLTPSGPGYVYMDDVYVDYTKARVEIGNNAVYNSCTHREIQIPTAWASGSISVTVNTGTFETDDAAYLFVVTDAGDISPGYSITIGESGGIPDVLAAPGNLQVGGGN